MATTAAKSLREKTSQELLDQLMLEKKHLFDGIVKSSTGEAIKPHEKRAGRRLIARIRSIVRERELRRELEKRIAVLGPQAQNASPAAARRIKKVEQRAAQIAAELAKTAEQGRAPKPMLVHVRARPGEVRSVADRAALKLAEAKRLRAALERVDVGELK
ncbi:MAG: 50S ribosomal protein L29 [Planctomycetota bacterium]